MIKMVIFGTKDILIQNLWTQKSVEKYQSFEMYKSQLKIQKSVEDTKVS